MTFWLFRSILLVFVFFTAVFSSAHRTFSRIDHILGHKPSLGKFKKIEITGIFSDHNLMKLDFSYRERTVKNTNTGRLSNMILNN